MSQQTKISPLLDISKDDDDSIANAMLSIHQKVVPPKAPLVVTPPHEDGMEDVNLTPFASKKPPVKRATNRGASFGKMEDLMLCKAWINASEDPIVGTSQKGTKFFDTLQKMYSTIIQSQEAYENKASMKMSDAGRESLLPATKTGELNGPRVYQDRMALSLYNRWKDKILPQVMKALGIEESIINSKPSGANYSEETIAQLTKETYERRHPSFGSYEWKSL